MDEQSTMPNREEAPSTRAPREVVLRYEAPRPRSIVERYVQPAPLPGRRAPEAAGKAPEPPGEAAEETASGEAAPAPKRSRKGLRIFLVCLGVLLAATVVLGVLYGRGVFTRRRGSESDRFEYEWHSETAAHESGETGTTIERWPNGDGTRLRYAETHGGALTIQEVYKRVNPCTVTIATALPSGALIGTGVIFTEDGYIVTNAHLIAGGRECYVVLDTGKSYDAKLVGFDEEQDLAVVKINAHGLPTAEFGDSDALTVGDTVYAIGNPLGVELRGTLTDGIVSAINRDVMVGGVTMTLIQTNAALNNGNSGGPLINVYGQVVGINVLKMGSAGTTATATVEGLGFAIPISSAAWMVDDLIAYGEIRGEPVLGISVLREPVTLETGETALKILKITAGGPGEAAGLALGDRVVRADGEAVESVNDLLRARRRYGVGEALTLEIDRDGERFTVEVILAESES